MVDLLGNTLVLRSVSGGDYVVRWYDAAAKPLTGWFDAGKPNGVFWNLRPLIGGGAALRVGSNWIATFASGKEGKQPVPAAFSPAINRL